MAFTHQKRADDCEATRFRIAKQKGKTWASLPVGLSPTYLIADMNFFSWFGSQGLQNWQERDGTKTTCSLNALGPSLGPYRYEPQQDKTNKLMCSQQRLRSAWVSTQPDQSWLCIHRVVKDPRLLHADSKDTGPPPSLIFIVFAGHTGHFVGFVVLRLIFCFSS